MDASGFKIEHIVRDDTQPPSETLRVRGELLGEHIRELGQVLEECLSEARTEVTLDLEGVQQFTSSGLGVVVHACSLAARAGIPLRVKCGGSVEGMLGRILRNDDDDDDDWTSGKRARLNPPDVPLSDANAKELEDDAP